MWVNELLLPLMSVHTLRKPPLGMLIVALLVTASPVFAESDATVFAIHPSAWLQQGEAIEVLKMGDVIRAGDRIVTGDTGRIEIRVNGHLNLRQNTSSEVLFQIGSAASEAAAAQPDLLVQAGKACVEWKRVRQNRNRFVIALGNTMSVTLHNEAHICVLHQDDLSSVHLHDGSVQITHTVDPNIIVLSESGSEFQVEFGESYSVLLPETGHVFDLASEGFPIPEGLQQVIAEAEPEPVVEVEPEFEVEVEAAAAVEVPVPSYNAASKYVYTVYLFSTRDEAIATNVNQRFHGAGIPTQIYIRETGDTTRYRIVVTGFSSREAAQGFADSIIGKHGIADTWIGRESRNFVE